MKLFIWNSLPYVTDNYHTDGGVVVVAEDLESAKELAAIDCPYLRFVKYDWSNEEQRGIEVVADPDFEMNLDQPFPASFVFPDAGCC